MQMSMREEHVGHELRERECVQRITPDVTEQVLTYRLLEERVEERTRELSTLLDVSHDVASTLDLDRLLPSLLDQFKRIVDYNSVTLSVIEDEDQFLWLEHRGLAEASATLKRWRPGTDDLPAVRNLARLREPIIIRDVRADTPEAESWRRNAEQQLGHVPEHARSWMAVPLLAKDRPIGILSFLYEQPGYYTKHTSQLALALANHAAVAIENARLFQAVQRGADQFRALGELAQRITSILDVDELLHQTVRLIQDSFGYYHVHIGLIQGDAIVLTPRAGVWEDEQECSYCSRLDLGIGQEAICSVVTTTGEPLLVSDISQEPRYLHPAGAVGSGIVVPLKVKGRVIGLLDVEHKEVNALDRRDVAVLQLLANQVAIAIENAHLYAQAQSLAALNERQKLARELHDSVSQALYGIGLGTRTALKMVEADGVEKAGLVQPLEYVLSLARMGMAEMRALIFELRPESLEVEGLIPALTRRVDAVRSGHEIDVEANLADEPELPLAGKEMLYRVAQEALHNVVKHAHASRVTLLLTSTGGDVTLEIRDDGCGFETNNTFPGHLGLQSMRERVEAFGGLFSVVSAPGKGTTVRVVISALA